MKTKAPPEVLLPSEDYRKVCKSMGIGTRTLQNGIRNLLSGESPGWAWYTPVSLLPNRLIDRIWRRL